MPSVILRNFLWVPKKAVEGTPATWAPEWEHTISLLNTPEGRQMQQQISALNEQLGDDESGLKNLTEDDVLLIKNWGETEKWYTLCAGNLKKVRKLAKRLGLDLRDERVEVPWSPELSRNLEMVMTARDHQVEPFEKWLLAGHGIFEAAPAFGKTFIMCQLIISLKQRTLVLAHTDALVEQFLTRFRHGSGPDDDGNFAPVTNCAEVEEYLGEPIIGRYRKPDKLFPVTVATWQSFSSTSGRAALRQISKEFGLVLCDEAHIFAAPFPARVVNSFYAKRKSGVTATPGRKDQLDKALYDVLGPITAKGYAKQLPLAATLISTGVTYRGSSFATMSQWPRMLNWLTKQSSRNDLIMEWIRHDVEQGRNILLLADRRQWCIDIVERMRREDINAALVLGGMTSKKGVKERNKIITQMMSGEIQVIAASKVFKEGVDIPNLDTLYGVLPQSNKGLLEQMVGRIRRVYDKKQEPVFRYFVDEGHGQLYGCARGTHRQLVELGANIVLVPTGKKPHQVTFGDGYHSAAAEGSLARRKKSSLRSAAARAPSGVSKLFDDLREEARQNQRYERRMMGEKA